MSKTNTTPENKAPILNEISLGKSRKQKDGGPIQNVGGTKLHEKEVRRFIEDTDVQSATPLQDRDKAAAEVDADTRTERKTSSYGDEIVSRSGSNDENQQALVKYIVQDVRIVQEDEMEQYLNKWSMQKEFAPNLQERADDVSRGENNVNGELKVAGETKKQTCDTSSSCWEEIPLDDNNDNDIPSESGSQSSFEVATTSPSPSVKAAKEMQDNADEALHGKFRMFNL